MGTTWDAWVVEPECAAGSDSLAHLESVPPQRDQAAGRHRGVRDGSLDEGAGSSGTHEAFAAGGGSLFGYGPGGSYLLLFFISQYECCGDKGPSDYKSLNMEIPRSCYHNKDGIHALLPYGNGCMDAVQKAYLKIYRYEKWAHIGLICYEVRKQSRS